MRKAIPKIIEFRDVGSYSDLPEEYAYGIRKCVSNAFGGGVTEDDALSHIMGEQVLVGIDYSDTKYTNVVGFSALSLNTTFFEIGQSHAYFAAAAIAKSHQGSGLYSILNDRRMDFVEEKKMDRIVTRTQNPRVEEGITKAVERFILANRAKSFEVSRLLVRAAYSGMLTDAKPTSRTISYDNIDYARGDANLINWKLSF